MILIYSASFDASCDSGRSYASGISFIIYHNQEPFYKFSKPVGKMTSMEAEYVAFIELLTKIIHLKIPNVQIKTDCKYLLEHMIGKRKVSNSLKNSYSKAKDLIEVQKLIGVNATIELKWSPRARNKVADKLCRESRIAGVGIETVNNNVANRIHINRNRKYLRMNKFIILRCPNCNEQKSFIEYPRKKEKNVKKICLHCLGNLKAIN